MKRILRSSLKNSNIDKEQIINNNPLKKQKLMIMKTSLSSPQYTPETPENNNETFSDVLTVDTPRSDDTNTLLSDTSDSDTITEEEDDVLDKEIAIRDQLTKEREQEKTNETVNKMIETSLIEHEEIINSNNVVKSKDKGKKVEDKKGNLYNKFLSY
jgi:hypothetical protein